MGFLVLILAQKVPNLGLSVLVQKGPNLDFSAFYFAKKIKMGFFLT